MLYKSEQDLVLFDSLAFDLIGLIDLSNSVLHPGGIKSARD